MRRPSATSDQASVRLNAVAWNDNLDQLRSVGADLIYGEHVWPLAEPRTAGPREVPWAAFLSAIKPFG
jgi:hypothetical protein